VLFPLESAVPADRAGGEAELVQDFGRAGGPGRADGQAVRGARGGDPEADPGAGRARTGEPGQAFAARCSTAPEDWICPAAVPKLMFWVAPPLTDTVSESPAVKPPVLPIIWNRSVEAAVAAVAAVDNLVSPVVSVTEMFDVETFDWIWRWPPLSVEAVAAPVEPRPAVAFTLLMIVATVSVAASTTATVVPASMTLNVSAAPRLPLLVRVVVAEATLPNVSATPPASEPLVVMAP